MSPRLAGLASAIALLAGGAHGQTVAAFEVVGDTILESLTGEPGDPARGEAIFIVREGGHCVLCHRVDGLDAPFQGNVGPVLSGVGDRLSVGQLRLRIADYQRVVPGALMPSYHRTHDLYQVAEAHEGQPILAAQDVEDLVAYLQTLKDDDAE